MRTAYCFDFDGTLTTTELLPCIAAELGIAQEIETLTRVTMDGHISFDQSLRLRALILGMVPIERVHAVISDVPLNPDLAAFIRVRRDNCFVVTGNIDLWLEPMLTRLGCGGFASRAILVDGRLQVGDVLDKTDAVHALRGRGFDRVIAVGDGANDLPMFEAADIAIAFGGVHSPARVATTGADFVVHEGRQLCQLLEGL
jgi:HAD superfamily phosphoserine phosphatase-like hydrolase